MEDLDGAASLGLLMGLKATASKSSGLGDLLVRKADTGTDSPGKTFCRRASGEEKEMGDEGCKHI